MRYPKTEEGKLGAIRAEFSRLLEDSTGEIRIIVAKFRQFSSLLPQFGESNGWSNSFCPFLSAISVSVPIEPFSSVGKNNHW